MSNGEDLAALKERIVEAAVSLVDAENHHGHERIYLDERDLTNAVFVYLKARGAREEMNGENTDWPIGRQARWLMEEVCPICYNQGSFGGGCDSETGDFDPGQPCECTSGGLHAPDPSVSGGITRAEHLRLNRD
jgi:hypothetical protein